MPAPRFAEIHPSQLLAGVFFGFIAVGTALLSLPAATHEGITFLDALFTATSATCVTGLMVVDAGSVFTPFGQAVILFLIQIGGLGIMTFSTFFMILLGKSLSMKEASIVSESFDPARRLSIRDLLKRVMALTFSIEAIGALALYFRFARDHEPARAAYLAVFHAVSGFCNAGISLFPDSLKSFSDDVLVNVVMGALIVAGSLGFITIVELHLYSTNAARGRKTRLSLQSKLVLAVTLALMLVGAASTFVMERDNVLDGLPLWRQVMASVFHSISRTAGFVTVDFHNFTNGALYVYIILMFIGAAPGSVGGGIKVTTFGVLTAMAASRFNAREKVSVFYRTIPENIVDRSVSILFISTQIVVAFTLVLLFTESGGHDSPFHREMFMQIMFEVVSAFGTVGLSAGATGHLTETGKALITLLMFIGRLGPLTVTLAVGRKTPKGVYQYSEENLMVG